MARRSEQLQPVERSLTNSPNKARAACTTATARFSPWKDKLYAEVHGFQQSEMLLGRRKVATKHVKPFDKRLMTSGQIIKLGREVAMSRFDVMTTLESRPAGSNHRSIVERSFSNSGRPPSKFDCRANARAAEPGRPRPAGLHRRHTQGVRFSAHETTASPPFFFFPFFAPSFFRFAPNTSMPTITRSSAPNGALPPQEASSSSATCFDVASSDHPQHPIFRPRSPSRPRSCCLGAGDRRTKRPPSSPMSPSTFPEFTLRTPSANGPEAGLRCRSQRPGRGNERRSATRKSAPSASIRTSLQPRPPRPATAGRPLHRGCAQLDLAADYTPLSITRSTVRCSRPLTASLRRPLAAPCGRRTKCSTSSTRRSAFSPRAVLPHDGPRRPSPLMAHFPGLHAATLGLARAHRESEALAFTFDILRL